MILVMASLTTKPRTRERAAVRIALEVDGQRQPSQKVDVPARANLEHLDADEKRLKNPTNLFRLEQIARTIGNHYRPAGLTDRHVFDAVDAPESKFGNGGTNTAIDPHGAHRGHFNLSQGRQGQRDHERAQ